MKESYSKNYFEKYASLTISELMHVEENKIVLSDRPDMYIPSLKWGIEVTQALTPEEAVADIKKPLYTLLDLNPFDHNHDDIEHMLQKIDDAIKRKEGKSKHYESFLHNGLYIFTHCINLKSKDLKKYLEQYSFQTNFYESLFFNCVSCVYEYHIATQELTCYQYSIKQLQQMNKQSLEYEKTCQKKRRKIVVG